MPSSSIHHWDHLSEDALWSLATDWRLAAEIRQEAMSRWLFPAEYGYSWANRRVQSLRTRCREGERNKRAVTLATVSTIG